MSPFFFFFLGRKVSS